MAMLNNQMVTSGETGRHGLRTDVYWVEPTGCAEESCKLCFHEVVIIVKVTKQPKSFFFWGEEIGYDMIPRPSNPSINLLERINRCMFLLHGIDWDMIIWSN